MPLCRNIMSVYFVPIWLMLLSATPLSAQDTAPKIVSVQPFSYLAAPKTFSFNAAVKTAETSTISSRLNSIVQSIHVNEFDAVQTGQLLITLDCRLYTLQLQREQNLEKLQHSEWEYLNKQLQRGEALFTSKNLSREDLDARRQQVERQQIELEIQRNQVESARLNQSYCKIYAPFDAIIQQRRSSHHAAVIPGSPLLELVKTEDRYVSAMLKVHEYEPDSLIRYISAGQSYPLVLNRISPIVDATSQAREYRFNFSSRQAPLGSHGIISWESKEYWIPAAYVLFRNDQYGVFYAEGNTARFHIIKNAMAGQDHPLQFDPATAIIVNGRHNLQPGDRIIRE